LYPPNYFVVYSKGRLSKTADTLRSITRYPIVTLETVMLPILDWNPSLRII